MFSIIRKISHDLSAIASGLNKIHRLYESEKTVPLNGHINGHAKPKAVKATKRPYKHHRRRGGHLTAKDAILQLMSDGKARSATSMVYEINRKKDCRILLTAKSVTPHISKFTRQASFSGSLRAFIRPYDHRLVLPRLGMGLLHWPPDWPGDATERSMGVCPSSHAAGDHTDGAFTQG